jgi:hypothetical protein
MKNPFVPFLNQHYTDEVAEQINQLAESHELNVNVIPDGVGNIDIDDNRVNVWVDRDTASIYKITFG